MELRFKKLSATAHDCSGDMSRFFMFVPPQ